LGYKFLSINKDEKRRSQQSRAEQRKCQNVEVGISNSAQSWFSANLRALFPQLIASYVVAWLN